MKAIVSILMVIAAAHSLFVVDASISSKALRASGNQLGNALRVGDPNFLQNAKSNGEVLPQDSGNEDEEVEEHHHKRKKEVFHRVDLNWYAGQGCHGKPINQGSYTIGKCYISDNYNASVSMTCVHREGKLQIQWTQYNTCSHCDCNKTISYRPNDICSFGGNELFRCVKSATYAPDSYKNDVKP